MCAAALLVAILSAATAVTVLAVSDRLHLSTHGVLQAPEFFEDSIDQDKWIHAIGPCTLVPDQPFADSQLRRAVWGFLDSRACPRLPFFVFSSHLSLYLYLSRYPPLCVLLVYMYTQAHTYTHSAHHHHLVPCTFSSFSSPALSACVFHLWLYAYFLSLDTSARRPSDSPYIFLGDLKEYEFTAYEFERMDEKCNAVASPHQRAPSP